MIKKIKRVLKSSLKNSLKRLGYVTYADGCLHNPDLAVVKTLAHLNINTIIDIGANVGQFAQAMYEEGFKGKIISLEPLKAVHETLSLKALEHTKCNPLSNWVVPAPIAIGDGDGESEINVCSRSSCSSITTMLAPHKEALPDAKFLSKEQIKIKTLDSIWNQYISLEDAVLIKIDVQGYEYKVLQGANMALSKAKAVLVEVSVTPLFESQKTWHEILKYLESRGFELWALNKAFVNEITGRDLQYNALMIKE
jgi:FkbM family methyltransferase